MDSDYSAIYYLKLYYNRVQKQNHEPHHNRDDEGAGMAHKIISSKSSLNLQKIIGQYYAQTSFQIDPKCFQKVATEFLFSTIFQ